MRQAFQALGLSCPHRPERNGGPSGQGKTPGCVHADDRFSSSLRSEQGGLGRQIVVHVAKIFEVVMAQIREPGNIHHHAIEPVLFQSLRAHLNGETTHTLLFGQRQHGVNVWGLRGGESALVGDSCHSPLRSGGQGGGPPEASHECVQEKGSGCFPVGPGHSGDGHGADITSAINLRRNCSQARPRLLDHNPWCFLGQSSSTLSIGEKGSGAGLRGSWPELNPVAVGARKCGKEIARLN